MNRRQRRDEKFKRTGRIPMNLQLFAKDLEGKETKDAGTEPNGTEDDAEDDDETDEDEANITPAELQRRLRSQKAKYEAEIATLNAKHDQKMKRAKMTEEQIKKEEEAEKDEKIAELENKVRRMELTTYATNVLSSKGLYPSNDLEVEGILSFVVREDEEATEEAIDALERLVTERVNETLKKKARTSTPGTSGKESSGQHRGSLGAGLAKKTQPMQESTFDPFAKN